MTIYKGDDTGAFGKKLLTIELENEEEEETVITKAEFQCGPVLLTFRNPEFPLSINLTKEQSKKLDNRNKCYLRVYGEDGLRETCEGTLIFDAKDEVVNAG